MSKKRIFKSKSVSKTKGVSRPTLNTPVALQLKQALVNHGYKGLQLEFLLTQAAHESGGFYKDKAINNNNFGGVKYNKNMKGVIASTDYAAPSIERSDKKRTPYAHFKDMDDFVKKWIPYAHINGMVFDNHEGPPIDAKNIDEYDHRLTLNRYHQETSKVYLAGLKRWDPIIKRELLQDSVATISMPDASLNKGIAGILLKQQSSIPLDVTSRMPIIKFADNTRIADPARVAMIKTTTTRK
jgi:hypothetical protein